MTFRILVCGDSIAWGQGLIDDQKYSALVEQFLHSQWPEIEIERQILAHSGAIIGIGRAQAEPAIDQEVPVDDPTIFQQVAQFRNRPEDAADVGLLLINGGINDINIRYILDPRIEFNKLREETQTHCYNDMLTLLTECMQVFPSARVVVTGYYPMISHLSDPVYILPFVSVFGLMLSLLIPGAIIVVGASVFLKKDVIDRIVTNCAVFAEEANVGLQRAVDEVNARLEAQETKLRIALAVPEFKPQNAVMAPDSYLYGIRLTFDPTEPVVPTDKDPVLGARIAACHAAKNSGRIPDYRQCKLASTGHPNVRGEQAYMEAISPILQGWLLEGWSPRQKLSPSSWLLDLLENDDSFKGSPGWLSLLLS